ncbi:NAD(+)/NADH kinase [Streptomyces sp. NBC_00201]|uniref:NAD(+)/NADH kinase n=1 Tax=unclassified Streptomyces TaxID=2593676 RepID=UPI00225C1862|nr:MULTISPECIES: NAD(+)/NADH kinase [unclassified Streptomyces]MCX5060110.1 NAD(+)/NADH kinase [Streptomyces sp. NBC_00452]MCX5252111.1 NAD(+)/NADH kinase [Streptomyces sp. NBC_00201]
MPISRLGLVVHGGRPEAVSGARTVREWCARYGIGCVDIDVWQGQGSRRSGRDEMRAAGSPDLIVTLGGDGTFLRGARIAAKKNSKVLGVDLGKVGFLTETAVTDVERALDAIHAGQSECEERMTLTVQASRLLEMPTDLEQFLCYGRGPALPPPPPQSDPALEEGGGIALDVTALNDVVVEKLARDRQVGLGVYIAGRLLASYSADGVIIATPTGSTAYSFAAGGPVLSPRMRAVIFTPVAPHMTFNRTVVASADEPIVLRVLPHSGRAAMSVDGQPRGILDPGDWIGVTAAPEPLRLVRLNPANFYGRLRERMRLTDAPATAADGEAAPQFMSSRPVRDGVRPLDAPPLP